MEIRLADFIREDVEAILEARKELAQNTLSRERMNKPGMRNHAREMLLEIAGDLGSQNSYSEQTVKSEGLDAENDDFSLKNMHACHRHTSRFTVMETVTEFRALRAGVVSLWSRIRPTISGRHFEELTRFHEAVDRAVAKPLQQYSITREMETRLFAAMLTASCDPVYVLDLDGRFTYANKATADLFALEPETIIGKSTLELGFSFAADMTRNLKKVIADKSTHHGEFVHTFSPGRGERFEYLIAAVLNEEKRTEAAVCIFRDVTARAFNEEKIWHKAHHDLLTGLPNRHLCMDRLEQEIKQAKRSSLSFSILSLNLDGFREVNELLGHDAGDRLLCDVAERLSDCVREADTIGRIGGDEFKVLLTGAQQYKDVARVAQTIIEILAMSSAQRRRRPAVHCCCA